MPRAAGYYRVFHVVLDMRGMMLGREFCPSTQIVARHTAYGIRHTVSQEGIDEHQ
ncbi:MAG: hypothetical protein ACR2L2_11130 [Acidobacteriota bacterium]